SCIPGLDQGLRRIAPPLPGALVAAQTRWAVPDKTVATWRHRTCLPGRLRDDTPPTHSGRSQLPDAATLGWGRLPHPRLGATGSAGGNVNEGGPPPGNENRAQRGPRRAPAVSPQRPAPCRLR